MTISTFTRCNDFTRRTSQKLLPHSVLLLILTNREYLERWSWTGGVSPTSPAAKFRLFPRSISPVVASLIAMERFGADLSSSTRAATFILPVIRATTRSFLRKSVRDVPQLDRH